MISEGSRISCDDWSRLEGALRELYAEGLSLGNYVERGLAAVGALVPGEFITYSRATAGAEPTFDIVFSTRDALPLGPLQAFMQLKDRYPLWRPDLTLNGGRPSMRSDFYSKQKFRDLPMFTEAYRPMGLDNHFSLPVTMDAGAAIHFSVQRKGGAEFTERDRAVIELLQPHLAAARSLARARVDVPELRPSMLASLGLTPRETEVFYWLLEGKRNAEIGVILKLGVQTVKNHVAAIFNKLHVESRHAAIRRGFEIARQSRADELLAAGEKWCMFQLRRIPS